MQVKILFFGNLTEITGTGEMLLEEVSDVNGLTEKLFVQFPALKDRTYAVAVNQAVSTKNRKLNDGDEVALLPPFAGG